MTKMAELASMLVYAIGNCQVWHVCMALVVLVVCHYSFHRKDKGPLAWPVVRMLPSLLWNINLVYDWMAEMLIECGGTFVLKGLWMSSLYTVVTCDPRNLDYILKTNFTNFPKGNHFRNIFMDVFGDGLFTADGQPWKHQRKCGSLLLSAGNFRNYAMEWIDRLIYDRLLPLFQEAAADEPVDFQDLMLRFTFDNICKTSLGVDPGCLSPNLPRVPFAEAFEEATEASVYRFVMPEYCWKFMRYFGLGMERKLRKTRTKIDEFVMDIIRDRKRELNMRCAQDGNRRGHWDALSGFMQLNDENGNLHSDKASRDFILSFILAGRDTAPIALSWFFWLLHRHPLVEEKLDLELLEILKRRPNTSTVHLDNPTPFTVEEIRQMKYLHASLSESMRLYPPVPVDQKEAIRDDVLPDGTPLSKGSKIWYFIYAIGRMESVWGNDCCEFKPERWLKDGEVVSETSGRYAVFNPGPRLCLGKDLAYLQMKMVAAAIIWHFHVRVLSGHPVVPRFALTLFMKHGLLVTLERRQRHPPNKFVESNGEHI
eukprot:Gb_24352 [translate_table: standard]